MPLNNPKISIITPSYNHEKYVKHFIESVLSQTEQDFELVIVDDNSTDNNVAEIKKFNDERIILIQHEYNKGINAGLNSAFSRARGKYIVYMSSDDVFEPNHLEVTSKYLEEHPEIDVYYSSLSLIDDYNNPIEERQKHYAIKQTDKYELLKKCFMKGNPLPSPGMVIRREAFEKIYPLDLSTIQFQDYLMHIRLLLNGDVHLSEQKLVKYRIISQATNISAKSSVVLVRETLEEKRIMDAFLQIKDIETLKKIFGNDLKEIGEPIKETIPYFLGMMALKSHKPPKKEWGYKTIMKFIANKEYFELIHSKYGMDYKRLLGLAANFDGLSNDLIAVYDNKVARYKKLFNVFLIVSIILATISIALTIGLILK